MFEMCLTLPFILVVLLMIMHFGRGIVRVQHAMVMDRYEAWRRAAGAPGPSFDDTYEDGSELNETFFGGKASLMQSTIENAYPGDSYEALIGYASTYSAETGLLASLHLGRADRGRYVLLRTTHPPRIRLMSPFERPISSDNLRIGNEWAWVNGWAIGTDGVWYRTGGGPPNMPSAVRDLFFQEFDEALYDLVSNGNDAARTLRSYYMHQPPYVGPTVSEDEEN